MSCWPEGSEGARERASGDFFYPIFKIGEKAKVKVNLANCLSWWRMRRSEVGNWRTAAQNQQIIFFKRRLGETRYRRID